jgi:hypothetical protein
MTERLVGLTFSDAEIRKMHLPLTDRPVSGLNDFCLLPAVGPGARAMTTRAVHLEKEDGSLACRVRREPDSLVTTDPRETTCPFCRGKKR